MGWKATGEPTVRRQRERWVVRVDGIDTETGKHRPKQLGTYPSQRAATVAARSAAVEGRAGPERGTVSWLVRRWVASRTDVSQKTREQYERLLSGPQWEDHDLIFATRTGKPVLPRSFDRGLRLAIEKVGNPRLSSHGLRHTAATHMVRHADDVGELRAAADVLGHSPDLLMRTYAHTLPESLRAVTAKTAGRAGD